MVSKRAEPPPSRESGKVSAESWKERPGQRRTTNTYNNATFASLHVVLVPTYPPLASHQGHVNEVDSPTSLLPIISSAPTHTNQNGTTAPIKSQGECHLALLRPTFRTGHSATIHPLLCPRTLVLGLAPADGDVFVLVHVRNLPPHGHEEEYSKVHDQYRPKHRHVEHGEERHEEARDGPLGHREPELELRQLPREGPVLLALGFRRGEGRAGPVVDLLQVQRRQEQDEVVEEVNSQPIRDDEVSLDQVNSQEEQGQTHGEADPSRHHVDGRLVQPVLDRPVDVVLVRHVECAGGDTATRACGAYVGVAIIGRAGAAWGMQREASSTGRMPKK